MANNQHSRYFGILSGKTRTYFKLTFNDNAWDLCALSTCGLQANFVIMQVSKFKDILMLMTTKFSFRDSMYPHAT